MCVLTNAENMMLIFWCQRWLVFVSITEVTSNVNTPENISLIYWCQGWYRVQNVTLIYWCQKWVPSGPPHQRHRAGRRITLSCSRNCAQWICCTCKSKQRYSEMKWKKIVFESFSDQRIKLKIQFMIRNSFTWFDRLTTAIIFSGGDS